MGFLDVFWHLAGFAAPALVLAPLVVLAARLSAGQRGRKHSWAVELALNLAVCLTVLAAGLIWTGHDGRMATYAALALASASAQWLLERRWRR